VQKSTFQSTYKSLESLEEKKDNSKSSPSHIKKFAYEKGQVDDDLLSRRVLVEQIRFNKNIDKKNL